MNAKELYDYYNQSKANNHLNISKKVVGQFLDIYPDIKEHSIKEADITLYDFIFSMFFG